MLGQPYFSNFFVRQMDACMNVILLYYATLHHTTQATSKTTLAIDPTQEEHRLQVSVRPRLDKKSPAKCGMPPSQRGKDERRIVWKEKNVRRKIIVSLLSLNLN